MKILKSVSVLTALIILICMTGITAYAAADLSAAQTFGSLTKLSFTASSDAGDTHLLRLDMPDSGRIKFYSEKFSVSSDSTYSILGSKGKELLTARLSSLKGKALRFKGAGTYYLKLSLTKGDSITNLLYTYSADNAANSADSISLRAEETADTRKYVSYFTSSYKWIISNSSVATIKNNKICALKPGKALIEAFSSKGEHAVINVFVRENTADSIVISGANMIWVGESFTYKYSYDDGKEYPDHEVVWSVNGKGSVDKNGKLRAIAKGDAVLTVTDKTSGLTSSMTVHFIESAKDVDFVPTVNGIQIANKTYPLPADYAPGFNKEAQAAYNKMAADAAKEGLTFTIISSYRSYNRQVELYKYWTSVYGKTEADRCSARPGFSEHQLGLAIDVNSCYYDFTNTPEAKWLAKNCWKYGFILRYPSVAAEKITGYIYEPWHIRYLGTETAKKVYESGLTLEEYLGIDSYYRN